MTASQIVHWITDHAAALWPVVSALLLVALRARTPEQWVALGERSPRVQGVVRLLRAVGLDPAKALSALSQIVTGRAPARAVAVADALAPRETQAPPPPPPSGQSGRVNLASLLVLLVVSGALLRCPGPTPPIDGGPAVTPSSWTATARVVLSTLRFALPAARAITDVVVAEPGRTQVARALDAAAQAAQRMDAAVTAYETAGGDRCAARAAVAGLHVALVAVAQTLADNGIALGTTLEHVVDGVASIADALVPACDADAGWSSAGDASNATLRAIAAGAGRPLSRVLDDLRPLDGGAR